MIDWDSPRWGQDGHRSASDRDAEGLFARFPDLAHTNVHESDSGTWVPDRHGDMS